MAKITFKGTEIDTSGTLPGVGDKLPAFALVAQDLSEKSLGDFSGKKVLLNIFPSLDTGICAASVREFHKRADGKGLVVLNISADLPFAQKRFCGAEGIESAMTLSTYRSSFAKDFGLEMLGGPLKGLCSRAVIVVDGGGKVLYTEQVPEIVQEPDYDAALKA